MAFGPITLGFLLLILSVFISMNLQVTEILLRIPVISGFVGEISKKEDLINIQCGVDMQPCPNGLRCMNGFCHGESIPPCS